MSDATTAFPATRNDAGPARICPRTSWPCPLHIHVRSCGGRYARPCDRPERLARLILKVRATDRFRGHAGTAGQNEDRVGLECVLCDALWDECRLAALDDAGDGGQGWDDPRVRQSAHDLYNDLMANARRASERDDYGRLPLPGGPDDGPRTPPTGGAGLPTFGRVTARPGDLAWSLLAGAVRHARRLDAEARARAA